MNARSRPMLLLVFTVLIVLISGCGSGTASEPEVVVATATAEPEVIVVTVTDEPEVRSTPQTIVDVVTATAEPESGEEIESTEPPVSEATETAEPEPETVDMSLSAQKAMTQYSPRPEPFVEPASVGDIVAPKADSWQTINPGKAISFHTYDGVRITEEGEAMLDLGNLMRLILRRDTIAQITSTELARDTLDKIQVDFANTPPLQKIALALHLSRGGFIGEKSIGSDPVVLTTPNAVVLVSGTTFFISFDPEEEITTVVNFEGTMDVADVKEKEGDRLPGKQIEFIPDVRGIERLSLADQLDPAEFLRLIDLLESPLLAADMVSGAYLVSEVQFDIDIHNGPGPEFEIVGSLAGSEYAKVIGKGRGWWQIECPLNARSSNVDCMVDGELISEHNVDDVPETVLPATPTPQQPLPSPTLPPTAVPIQNTATPLPLPSPTGSLPGNPLPLTGGSYNGCPLLSPGQYTTDPYGCDSCPSMDMARWTMGTNLLQVTAAYEENGDIHLILSGGQDVNLNALRHRWMVEIHSVSRAIETWEDSITHIGLDQLQMYSIVGPGTTVGYLSDRAVLKVTAVCGD